jgi:hypothetical protein
MRKWIDLCEGWMAPAKLYHGTYAENVPSIMKEGLKPERSQSSLEAVFLAVDPATARNYEGHHMDTDADWVILEIDATRLISKYLGPDNYELGDMLEELDEDDPCYGMNWRDVDWSDSLRICGQCAYYLTIRPDLLKVI